METLIIILTFAITILNLIKIAQPSVEYPYFVISWTYYDVKVSPTMWYFFYPSLLYQIFFWFSKYQMI